MPYCIYCGTEVKLSDSKCPKCHQELPEFAEKEDVSEFKIDEINMRKASPTKRIFSGLIDLLIGVVLPLLVLLFTYRKISLTGMKLRWIILGRFILPFIPGLYLILKDSLGGKSFGKMILGLTTINLDRRKPADLADSILRNSVFIIGLIPVVGWLAIFFLSMLIGIQIIMGSFQRIGDKFAHTAVIEDIYVSKANSKKIET